MLVREVIELFRKYMGAIDRSPETIRGYMVEMRCWMRFLEKCHNGQVYLDEINTNDVEEYLVHMKDQGQSPASRSRFVYIVKSFYNFCYKKDLVERNLGVKLEPVSIPQKERSYLTPKELDELIKAIEHPLIQLVVMTLAFTGLRISECLNLTLTDVDLTGKTILARNTKGKRDRRIPIHHDLLPKLQEYRDTWRDSLQSDNFFATHKTGRLSPAYVNVIVHKTVAKLGWTKTGISCHSMRHSFATNLVKNKQSIVLVQKLLGHSKLATTGIYTHADMDDLADAVNAL